MIPCVIFLALLITFWLDGRKQHGIMKPRLDILIDVSPTTPTKLALAKANEMLEYIPASLRVRITLFAHDILFQAPYECPEQARSRLLEWNQKLPEQITPLPRLEGPNFACLVPTIKQESRRLLLPPPNLLVLTDSVEECTRVFTLHKLPLRPKTIPDTIAAVEAQVG
jgi:hypothetical protein